LVLNDEEVTLKPNKLINFILFRAFSGWSRDGNLPGIFEENPLEFILGGFINEIPTRLAEKGENEGGNHEFVTQFHSETEVLWFFAMEKK
jgi:hypothetical protein